MTTAVDGRRRIFVFFCCMALVSAFVIRSGTHNNGADTLEEVVDHYIELFKFIKAVAPQGLPPPPVASTDEVNFDRQPTPEERAALLAYLRKL